MSILDEITANKYREVEALKKIRPAGLLEKSSAFHKQILSLKKSLLAEGSEGIIAEFKRRSPSRGIINSVSIPEEVCAEYINSGASAVSVLTEEKFFNGSVEDLMKVRAEIKAPVLRKDFIVDEYQIIEARSFGADAILLITEMHEKKRLKQLHSFAKSLELEVLIEIYDEKNISRIPSGAEMIGINSRNLASFAVDLNHLSSMIKLLPSDVLKVAESGISSVSDYYNLKNSGFDAFLIGEYFMKSSDPGKACNTFMTEIKSKVQNT